MATAVRGKDEEKSIRQKKELQQGVNFINILRAAFARIDPKSVKRY